MTKTFPVGKDLSLPFEILTTTSAVMGIPGSGKTHTATVIVEQLLKAGHQVTILDPLDVWWGLRSSRDGEKGEFNVIVFGGEHGDVPLDEQNGKQLADFIVESGRSAIISVRHLSKNAQRKLVADFAESLYHKKGRVEFQAPILFVIDEADAFAPQKLYPGTERTFGAIDDLVRRGRSSGIGVMLITQRAAVLNKDVLTQVELMICHRTVSPQDRKAIEAWTEVHDAEGVANNVMKTLHQLRTGEAWFWSPGWLELLQKVQVQPRITFDSSATPKLGQKVKPPKKFAEVDIDSLRRSFEEAIKKAEADDPRALKKRIAELEKELKSAAGKGITAEQLGDLKEAVRPIAQILSFFPSNFSSLEKRELEFVDKVVAPWVDKYSKKAKGYEGNFEAKHPRTGATVNLRRENGRISRRDKTESSPDSNGSTLKAGERRMLQILEAYGELTKTQLGTLAGFTSSGGTFGAYFGTLRRHEFIAVHGDKIVLTPEGRRFLGNDTIDRPQSNEELRDQWRKRLKAGEALMLEFLCHEYPQSVTKHELGTATGFESTGGTFNAYLGTLRRNNLAEVEGGMVKAGEALFL